MRKSYLVSKIPIKAKLKCKLASVARVLEFYPELKLVGGGRSVRYLIGNGRDDHFYTLEFSRDSILMTIHSEVSPFYYMQEAILRLLGLLAVLGGRYCLELESLYPYLINVLASQQLARLEEKVNSNPLPEANINSDIILARRINKLLSERSALSKDLSCTKNNFYRVFSSWISMRYGNNIDSGVISRELGIEKKEVESSIKEMERSGYVKVNIRDKILSMVKL